jgi:hypothetical protein
MQPTSNSTGGGKIMKLGKMAIFVVLFALVAPLLVGCASSLQARKVDVGQTVLVNPDILQKGTEGQPLYRYVKPNIDLKKYTKVIVDPVIVFQEAALDAETRENYQKLANNAYAYFTKNLEKDYTVVTTDGPDALRIQFAIVSAEKSAPVRNFMTTIVPVGMVISTVKYGATGKPIGVGEITAEARITDASTGELLGAALDKRVGGKQLRGVFSSWQDADSALQFWAELMRYRLCQFRGAAECEKLKP